MRNFILAALALAFCASANAQRKTEIVEPVNVPSADDGLVLKRKVAIGRFSNETQYAKGIFYDKENDPMGKQALDILSAKLAASGKFLLLERSDLASLLEECHSEKSQTVEAAVSIRLVDVSTGVIIYSDEGKGYAELTTKTTMGLGGQASYDATLSDKAISEAIGQLVENIINKCTDSPWKTYFLSCDDDAVLVAGGKSQGLKEGMVFDVKTQGKKVKNPQTGIMITLPGKTVGTATIVSCGGDTPETEYSFVEVSTSEKINADNMSNYIIEQKK